MSLIRLNRHPSPRQLLVFALAWAVVLGLAGWAQARHGRSEVAAACGGLAVAVPVFGAVWREGLRRFYVGLCLVTYPIGLGVSSVVLGVLFYGVLTPIGLVLRLTGYDPLQRRFDRQAATYWQPRPAPPAPETYFRQH